MPFLLNTSRLSVLLVVTVTALAVTALVPATSVAQEDVAIAGSEVESTWRFGLRILSTGNATKVVATYPIPIECEEQTTEEIDQQRVDGVSRPKTKTIKPEGRQVVFKIASMQPADEAVVATTFRVTKKKIEPPSPEIRSSFQFAKTVRGTLRQYVGPSPFIESDEDRIVEIANTLAAETQGEPAWRQVEAIYDWVRENVRYEFDTQIHSCLEALDNGKGDCEELSSLFIAICRARDIPARAVWIPGHTYPEFYLEDADGAGHWFPCQAAGTRQFGGMDEARPILQKGDRFRISGQRELSRYVQPTLKASDADGQLKVESIVEEIK